jgi:hypothetical protein
MRFAAIRITSYHFYAFIPPLPAASTRKRLNARKYYRRPSIYLLIS